LETHPLPSRIQGFKNNISEIATDLKRSLEDESKRVAQIEEKRIRNQRLFPKTGAIVNLVSEDEKYVCLDNRHYLTIGDKNSASLFLVNVVGNQDKISLTCNGKVLHRTYIDGWVGLYDQPQKPLTLKICPEPHSILFTLFSEEDKITIGLSNEKYLKISSYGSTLAKFRWVLC